MQKSETREALRQAQTARVEADEKLASTRAAHTRAQERARLLDEEIAQASLEEQADARTLADAIAAGTDAPAKPAKQGGKSAALRASAEQLAAAVALLESDVSAAEAGVESAGAALNEAVAAVANEHIAEQFERAKRLHAELREVLAALNIGSRDWLAPVEGLRQFVDLPGHDIDCRHPDRKRVSAQLRAWRAALAKDPDARLSVEAGFALENAEAAAQAEEEAKWAAEEAAFRAERQAIAQARYRPAEPSSGLPVTSAPFSRVG